MTTAEYLHLIKIAKLFLAITANLETRAHLRIFIGECTSRARRHQQHNARLQQGARNSAGGDLEPERIVSAP